MTLAAQYLSDHRIWTCRANALKDALGLLYALLRAEYLQECSALAGSPESWQYREVAVYAMRWGWVSAAGRAESALYDVCMNLQYMA